MRIDVRLALAAVAIAASLAGCRNKEPNPPAPPGSTITVSGRITFDRVPFRTTLGTGLNPTGPTEAPARQVVVEAIDASSNAILATTTTDTAGDYTLSAVPAGRSIFIRAKAQMSKTGTAPTWTFSVRNNTNADALYALDGSSFNSGTTNVTGRNLRATSGWGTTDYSGTRAAAPFAILDTVYRAKELILTASASAAFPALDLFWSPNNRTASPICPDNGDISTSFYVGAGSLDDCSSQTSLPAGIYILGDFAAGNGDTDEFDQHVIAHEFGHYIEDQFARSDSIGGEHGAGDRLDLRLAFGEGWGNAYSAMSLGDPLYRDSFSGIDLDFSFNVESDSTTPANSQGWFSESSVQQLLYDFYDSGTESGDTVALGFAPIFAVLTDEQVSTDALTSIFSFAAALRSENSGSAGAITTMLANESISNSGAFGENETNNGGDTGVLPIYRDIVVGTPVIACTRALFGDGNKLGYSAFLRFDNSTSRTITVTATGAVDPGNASSVAAQDPDIYVTRRGEVTVSGFLETTPTQTTMPTTFSAGIHIIEVQDFELTGAGSPPHCMTVSLTAS